MSDLAKDGTGLRAGVTVNPKNQITFPAATSRAARMRPGDRLGVEVTGRGPLRLSRDKDPIDEPIGV